MERNKVKIICNLYCKAIEYKRWGIDNADGMYKQIALGSKSQLVLKNAYVTIEYNA